MFLPFVLQGHDRDICKKVEMLELFDTVMGTFLQQAYASARGKLILVVTGDHSTSPDYGDHTCEPVPILFADISHEEHQEQSMLTPDAADKFDELTIGTHGSLGRFPSSEIIPLIQNLVKGPKVVQKAEQKLVQKYVLSGN